MQCNTRSSLLVVTMVVAVGSLVMLDQWLSRPAAAQQPASIASEQFAETEPGDRAEEPPGEEEREHEEAEQRELQLHRTQLELERAELEANFGRLELITRIANIANEHLTAVAYAVVQIDEFVEEEELVPFLEELLEKSQETPVKRIIHIKLAELYRHMDRPEDAKDQLRALVMEK